MINLAAISHRRENGDIYQVSEQELIVKIRTAKDVQKVIFHSGDPFSGGILGGNWTWNADTIREMKRIELKHHDVFTTQIKIPTKRSKYYFEIHFNQDIYYLTETDIYSEVEFKNEQAYCQYFIFPWMNNADVIKSPSWVKDTIWYQIFPDRFCNLENEGYLKWHDGPVTNDEVYGGNLKGITSKLQYLKKIGISGIYLTPIFKSPSVHKYNINDYYQIDPNFGTKEELLDLVYNAHKLGIKIMLDLVFNHIGSEHYFWQDVLQNGANSKYYDWFIINNYQEKMQANQLDFYAFAFEDSMPKLNTNNPEVMDYLIGVAKYYVNDFGIDAIRMDVANETSLAFNRKLNQEIKSVNPDVYIVGEIWHDAANWVNDNQYDGIMNYPLTEAILNVVMTEDLHRFRYNLNRINGYYFKQRLNSQFNLLDSHDTNRLLQKVNYDKQKYYQSLLVLMVLPGTPCIYYGTEQLLDGSHDPDCRRLMHFSEPDKTVVSILKFRNKYKKYITADVEIAVNDEQLIITYPGLKVTLDFSVANFDEFYQFTIL